MPIIVLGLIFGGICTVSEAAAISALYSAIVGMFIYRTVSFKNLLNTLYETTISVSAIMILVGLSKASAYVVISSQLPQLFMETMTSLVSSKFVVLLMINVIFLILGCLMEGNCIIVMMVPLMLNLVNSFGIDLIQFGILTCINIYIGCITPPVGVSLLVGAKLGDTSVGGAFKSCLPIFGDLSGDPAAGLLCAVVYPLAPQFAGAVNRIKTESLSARGTEWPYARCCDSVPLHILEGVI